MYFERILFYYIVKKALNFEIRFFSLYQKSPYAPTPPPPFCATRYYITNKLHTLHLLKKAIIPGLLNFAQYTFCERNTETRETPKVYNELVFDGLQLTYNRLFLKKFLIEVFSSRLHASFASFCTQMVPLVDIQCVCKH